MDGVRIDCRTTERERELARTLALIRKTPHKGKALTDAADALRAELDKRSPRVPGPYRHSEFWMMAYANGWRLPTPYNVEYALLEPPPSWLTSEDDGAGSMVRG